MEVQTMVNKFMQDYEECFQEKCLNTQRFSVLMIQLNWDNVPKHPIFEILYQKCLLNLNIQIEMKELQMNNQEIIKSMFAI